MAQGLFKLLYLWYLFYEESLACLLPCFWRWNIRQYRTERYDTSYYMSYRNKLTLGAVAIKKSTVFKTGATDADQALRFRPNSPGRLGISVAHDFIGLSATFGVGLDPSYSEIKAKPGKPIYRWACRPESTGRYLLQKYKGFIWIQIPITGIAPSGNKYYIRPDIETALYGTKPDRNSRNSAPRPPFLLDAWQRSLQGSLLYGGEFLWKARLKRRQRFLFHLPWQTPTLTPVFRKLIL